MKNVTIEMINEFKIKKKGYDFMGYKVKRRESLSFHHLIVAHRDCKKNKIPSDGYVKWNGAILVQETSHDYLHIIERYSPEIFFKITSEMIDMNIKGYLDVENLKNIRRLLLEFEEKYGNITSKKGNKLIKKEYLRERIDL